MVHRWMLLLAQRFKLCGSPRSWRCSKPVLDQELGWTNEQYGYVNSAFQRPYALSLMSFSAGSSTKYGNQDLVTPSRFAVCECRRRLAMGLVRQHAWISFRPLRPWCGGRRELSSLHQKRLPIGFRSASAPLPPPVLFNSGPNVGPILAPAIVPWIALAFGWRATFVGRRGNRLIVAGVLVAILNAPEKSRHVSAVELAHIQGDRDAKSDSTGRVNWWVLFALRPTWAYMLTTFLTDPISWFCLSGCRIFFKKNPRPRSSKKLVFISSPSTQFRC